MTVRVNAWSGPRNISTAMMRAWENRPDTIVFDEPFYASYLHHTGLEHPAREEVLASQPTDPAEVVAQLRQPLPEGRAVAYAKQMSHHLLDGDDLAWASEFRNVLLIRDPSEVVASYVKSRAECAPEDIGLLQQARLLDVLDETPPVIDAADFLQDPERHLRWLCEWLGIGFTDAMLHWPAGPRDSDGVWAPHWYDAVWASTGFEPYRHREPVLTFTQQAVADACRPAYDQLRAHRITP